MKKFRLLIACGGTGGHIFPATALAEVLKNEYPDTVVCFAGVFKSHIRDILRKSGYRVHQIKGRGMPHRLNILILPFLFRLTASFITALDILKKENSDIVISMGSFSGAPFVFAGKLLGLSVLIHEQNLVPGRANRLTGCFADKIAVSFDKTTSFFSKRIRRRIVNTGNPVRRQILGVKREDSLKFFGFSDDKFTILVMGGSQGAHAVNKVFLETVKELDKDKFQIIHLTGESDYELVINGYGNLGIKNKIFAFLDEMGKAYALADLVISRAGAITITEIISLGLASILVPYPYGDAHQRANAQVLKNLDAAILIEEKDLTKSILLATIRELSENKTRLKAIKNNSLHLARPDASKLLMKEVVDLA